MPSVHSNLPSRGSELGKREDEEDTISESSTDNSSSPSVLVAGLVLVSLFVAPQVRNFQQNRRRRKRRINSSVFLCKDTYGLKHEVNIQDLRVLLNQEYSFSTSDMDTASDDDECQVPPPSPRFVESRLSMQGFELDCSELSDEIENVSHTGDDGWQRQNCVDIERVNNLVYRRRVVDGGDQSRTISAPALRTNSRSHSFQEFSNCLDEPKESNRNTDFIGSLKHNGGLVELL